MKTYTDNMIHTIDNKSSFIRLVRDNPTAWKYIISQCDKQLLESPDIFHNLIKNCGKYRVILKYMPSSICNRRNFVLHAITQNVANILYIGKKIKYDKRFMLFIVSNINLSSLYIDDYFKVFPCYFKTDSKYWLKIIETLPEFFKYIHKKYNNNYWISKALEINFQVFEFVPDKFKHKFPIYRVKLENYIGVGEDDADNDNDDDKHVYLFSSSDEDLKKDKKYVLRAITNWPKSFKHASPNLRNDLELCKYAVSLYNDNIIYCSKSAQKELNYKLMADLFDKEISLAHMRLIIGRLPFACDILILIFDSLPKININILYKSYEELIYKKSINTEYQRTPQ